LDWLLLAGLGIMWVAFLAQVETYGEPGRWIITPRKGVRFLGRAERHQARTRERRKRVFVFLLEAIGLTFMIGFAPPLRVAWTVTFGLIVVLLAYIWVLVSLKHRAPVQTHERVAAARAPGKVKVGVRSVAPRYVSDGRISPVRQTFGGLGALAEGDGVHVVVRQAHGVRAAEA
jgi:hypothetical protein